MTWSLDEDFLRTDSNGSNVPLADALESTVETTDMNENPLTSFWYSPFGDTTTTGAQISEIAQYAGFALPVEGGTVDHE